MSNHPADQVSKKSYRLFRIVFVGLILLTVVVLASVVTEIASMDVRKKLNHALSLERDMGLLLTTVQDAETGQRGYLLTNDRRYLTPYRKAQDTLEVVLTRIDNATADNTLQQTRSNRVRELTDQKMDDIRQSLSYFQVGDTTGLQRMLRTQTGKSLMDSVRLHIELLRMSESRDVRVRQNQLDSYSAISTFLRFLGVLGLATVFYYIYSQLQPLVTDLNNWNESMLREIEERKRVEKVNNELIESLNVKNHELDQFAYIASHDLREPLRTVSNYVEVLGEDHSDNLDDAARSYLSIIHRATDRMKGLIETLLQYGRIGRTEKPVPVDIAQVIREAVEDLQLRVEESGAEIRVGQLPQSVVGYPVAIRQLFQNLLANALKFAQPGEAPRIEIDGVQTEAYSRITVKDHGIGIEPENQKKIFELFTRLNSQDNYEGQGIGLAFCQKIVQLHQGSLTVRSRPGEGSTFTVTIPRSFDHEEVRVRSAD